MSKKANLKNDKSVSAVVLSADNAVNVSREATCRQAICKEAKKLKSEVRIDTCNISKKIMNINSFEVSSQAMLIDLIIRNNEAITISQIAIKCMSHKDFDKVFNVKNSYIDVLKRVKRHNNIDSLARVIKRNSYQL